MQESIFLPLQQSVQNMWAELLGRQIVVKQAPPQIFAADTPGCAASYVVDSGQVGVVALCDLKLSCYAGAALMLMPVATAEEGIKKGVFTPNIVDNLREILNVSASLFIHEPGPHVRLHTIYPLPGELPEEVSGTMGAPKGRMDLEIAIAGYGAGKLSFLIT